MTDNAPFPPSTPPVPPQIGPHPQDGPHVPAGPYGPDSPHIPTGPSLQDGPLAPAGPDTLIPLPGLPFGSSYRTPRARWWRGALSIAVVIAAVLLFSIVLSVAALAIDMILGLQDPEALVEGQISMTPAMLAATNLSLIVAAALSLIAHRFINGVRVGYFHSVAPGLRWGWMWLSFALVAPVYLLFAASSFLDPVYQTLTFSGTTLAFFFVIILTTPLQAAAEEYMFRGVIQRSVGSWFRSPRWSFVVGTAVSATVFSAAHFAADIWLIVYYLLFGVLLSILTQRTGGVEAAIAIHTANNLFLLLVSAVSGQMDAGFDRSAGVGGPVMLVPVVILAVVIVVVSWVGKRRGLATVTGDGSDHDPVTTDAEAAAPPNSTPWTGSGQQAGE